MLAVAYGGGVNSTALLCGFAERDIVPDVVLFADTGGEKPETYTYLWSLQAWLESVHFPSLFLVHNGGMYRTLENNCLSTHALPSLAYGWRSCSEKYKKRPQDVFMHHFPPAIAERKAGRRIIKAIGYDTGESRRARIFDDDEYTHWYPLIDWGWGREECVSAIRRNGLAIPQKSACFFCPASTKKEVLALAENHPDLMHRALAIEENAQASLQTVKGLGRRWSWNEFLKARAEEQARLKDPEEMPCGCFDGTED